MFTALFLFMDLKKIFDFLQNEANKTFFKKLQESQDFSINSLQKLYDNNPGKPVKDLLSLIGLQRRNQRKIPAGDKYLFTEKGVQQASSTVLAKYHAEKFQEFQSVADLCCGIGMDLIQIAEGKKQVYAVDSDEETFLAAKYNSRTEGLKNITFLQQNAEDFDFPVKAIFADPDRRPGNKRSIQKDDIQPTLDELVKLRSITENIAIKLSPAMNYKNMKFDFEHTYEFVSENGTLKEMLLCMGKFATPNIRRKAVLLPQKIILSERNVQIGVDKIGQYIFEPDAAIIRAGLVQECGAEIGYKLIDEKLALLSGEMQGQSELGKCFKVKRVTSYKLKELQKYCRENEIGDLVIKTRGFPEMVEDFRKKLKLKGKNKETVFIVRKGDAHFLIFASD
ncbi:MAG: methyltransferase domain-containing protein [Candidatus Cloacimonadales bacterium]|nr:methyltransferase domain-containing protein [Candidatus Cloacimonadales bacterium]